MRDFSVRFQTELFDYRTPIPEEANAGNRFYGRDVAEFLSRGMASPSLATDFLDEDWGWLVLGKTSDEKFIEIAVYNLSDEAGEAAPSGNEWGLWVRAFEKRKWLGLFNKSYEVELPEPLATQLARLLRDAGIEPFPWKRDESDA
jgi:hypothetical protein